MTAVRINGDIEAQVHADCMVCLVLLRLTGDVQTHDTPWSAAAIPVPNQGQQHRSS